MATDYQGIKIYDKVIIVEKESYHWENGKRVKDLIPQGYVVEVGNKNMLETAKKWAHHDIYAVDENNNYIYDENGHHKYKTIEGIINTYENGKFKFELEDAADGSTQGGKLSFWNCLITAPDNKKYLIGISSEILLNLLKQNTFKNGICESNVWLGRIKGQQVGAFTENMPEFTQAKADQALREAKNTKKYLPGAILKSKTKTQIYLGEFTEYFSMQHSYEEYKNATGRADLKERNIYFVLDDEPYSYHVYLDLSEKYLDMHDAQALMNEAINWDGKNKGFYDFPYYISREDKKLSRVVVGQTDLSNINIYDFAITYKKHELEREWNIYHFNKAHYDNLRKCNANANNYEQLDINYRASEAKYLYDVYFKQLEMYVAETKRDIVKFQKLSREELIEKLEYHKKIINRIFVDIDNLPGQTFETSKILGVIDKAEYLEKHKYWSKISANANWWNHGTATIYLKERNFWINRDK